MGIQQIHRFGNEFQRSPRDFRRTRLLTHIGPTLGYNLIKVKLLSPYCNGREYDTYSVSEVLRASQ